jgi:pyrophosphatase PpaX
MLQPRCFGVHRSVLVKHAVLFDLDGTLVDLRAVYIRAHQLAAREVLALELEEARIVELMATGSPIRTHMAHLDETAADVLAESFIGHYRREREGLARAFPGMGALLGRLRSRGIPVAVVTSKLREDTLAELAATGLDESVDAVIAFEDTTEHKPAPAPHLEALRRLGATGGIGVGDLPGDVLSARAAGLSALAVAWGYGAPAALRDAGAERVCETADELGKALERALGQPPA